ncbi:hypothetical protein OT109_04390 [Phycisphaeraceae bacterium D3-23]
MFFWRKIGKTLRGSAKPYQVISAAMLGGLIGFAPSVMHGPLWLALLLILLAVLNANLFVATLTAGFAKLLSYLLLPVSFQLGLLLVDGPLESLFRWLINAPVTALMGFDYYTTAGGIVLGATLGAVLGVVLVGMLRKFRTQMAKLETDSKKYHDWAGKGWVKALSWVFFGGRAKQSYAELMEQKKFGNPVRPLGIVFALLLVGFLFVVQQFGSGPIVAWALQDGLQRFTGATVDLDDAEIDLASGRMTVGRLAAADPNALDTDMLRATRLTADISTSDLLRKRITFDSVVIDDAQAGVPRQFPGRRIGEPTPDPPPSTGEAKTIEEWFETAKVWRSRLETARDLLERLRGLAGKDDDSGTIRGRARDRAERMGYANVRAVHLIDGAPTLLVRDLKINTIRADWPAGETTDLHATNLSTHPSLVPDRPRVTLNTSGQTLALDATLAPRGSGLASDLSFALRNQSVDAALGAMDLGSQTTFTGGTWSVALDGGWSETGLDLPMVLRLTDTVVALPEVDPVTLDKLPIEFGVTGDLGAPRLTLDRELLVQTLMDAGARQIAGQYLQLGEDKLRASILDGIDEEHSDALAPLLGEDGELLERGGNLLRGIGDRLRGGGDSEDTD